MGYERPKKVQEYINVQTAPEMGNAHVTGYYIDGNRVIATLSNGRVVETYEFEETPQGLKLIIDGKQYVEKVDK